MTKASDNVFPRFLVSEGGSTATPAANRVTVYAKADGLLYSKDDGGAETLLSSGVGILASLFDTKGDLIVASAADTPAKLAAGTNGYLLVANSGATNGIEWVARTATINFVIDGGGAEIADGVKGDVRIPFACIVNSWTLLADQSGAIVVDIWKDTLANFPPTDVDSMCSGKEPTIAASGTNATDTTITDWTTDDIAADDILRFNVDSCTTIQRCTLALKVTRV